MRLIDDQPLVTSRESLGEVLTKGTGGLHNQLRISLDQR